MLLCVSELTDAFAAEQALEGGSFQCVPQGGRSIKS